MAIGKMKYRVFCSAKLQWDGRKLKPFAHVRASGHAEQLCSRLMKDNPGAVCAAFGPGYKYVAYPTWNGKAQT